MCYRENRLLQDKSENIDQLGYYYTIGKRYGGSDWDDGMIWMHTDKPFCPSPPPL